MMRSKVFFLAGFFVLGLFLGLALLLKPAQAAAVSNLPGVAVGLDQASPSGAQSPLACNPDVPGMIAYWPADSIAGSQLVDEVGGHNGACSGASCPTSVPGKVNNALTFDGNDRLDVPHAPEFNFANGNSFSIELWVKMGSSCAAERQVFFGKYRGSLETWQSWWVGCEVTDQAAFNLRDSTGQTLTINGGPSLNDENWHHVVAMRNASENRLLLYVDGALATAQTQTYVGDFAENQDLNFGYYDVSPFYQFSGSLDEISLYNRPLTPEEVQRHYSGGAGKPYCNQPPVAAPDGPFVAIRNTPLTLQAEALLGNDNDPENDPIVISAIDSMTAQNGTITGSNPYTYTPPTDYSGMDSFMYSISDGISGTDTTTVTITIRETNAPPGLTKPANQVNSEGDAVSLQLQGADPDGDKLAYTAANLPEGVSLDPDTGLISGTLSFSTSSQSPYTVEVTVTDAGFLSDTKTFLWTVTNVNGAPVMQQPSNQFNNEGDVISMQIEASDPDNDKLTYSITGLPDGLSYNPNTGLISGSLSYTSSEASPYTVSVKVSDPFSNSVDDTFQWIVTDASPPIIYLPLVLNSWNEE